MPRLEGWKGRAARPVQTHACAPTRCLPLRTPVSWCPSIRMALGTGPLPSPAMQASSAKQKSNPGPVSLLCGARLLCGYSYGPM